MLTRANAQLAAEFFVVELLIGDAVEVEILGRVDDAGAARQGKPVTVSVAQRFRNGGFQNIGIDRLGDAGVHQVDQGTKVHRHQEVSRGAFAFGLHALDQAAFEKHRVDRDTGLGGEGIENGLDQAGLAGRVDVDFLCQGRNRRPQSQHADDTDSLENMAHGGSP